MVEKVWGTPCCDPNPINVWQTKVRVLRRLARGWEANVIAENNRNKQVVTAEHTWLDMESQSRSLVENENNRMRELAKELEKLWDFKEIKAR
jgi:hypothetical protein